MEERRLRIDNEVGGVMNEALYLHAFVRAPYRWNTVGFMEDLRNIALEQARRYFETYYAPNNAVLVLAGDLEPARAFALVQRHFGGIPRRRPPAPVDSAEPPQDGERRIAVRKNAQLDAVLMGYKGVPVRHPDRPALDVLERVLSGGDSARLDEDLVREHEVATGVEANNGWGIDQELFWIYAQARPKKDSDDLEDRIDAVVDRLKRTPVPEDELRKAKNQLSAELVRGMKTVSGKANRLGYFDVVFGDYRALFGLDAGWEAVTAEDVRRVAETYLTPHQRTVVVLEPVPAGPPVAESRPKPGPST
jgi:predicted Zn-dependent peptidase